MTDSGPRAVRLEDLSDDRRELALLLAGQQHRPATPTEQTLWRLWSETLARSDFGVHHHYLELGGDSIQAIQIVARARRQGLPLETRNLFELGTISRIAVELQVAARLRPSPAQAADGRVVLTPMQQWFLDQRFADASHWNQSFLLQAAAGASPELFRTAFEAVCARHEAFRTRVVDGTVSILPSADAACLRFEVYEGTARPLIERVAAALNADLRLDRGPLLAVAWFTPLTLDARPLLLVAIHHFISDGISLRILLDEVAEICEQTSASAPAREEASARAGVWAAALAARVDAMDPRPVLEHLERCATLVTDLPVDFPGAENLEADAVTRTWVLAPDATAQLMDAGARYWRSTMHELLVAAFARTLANIAGSNTVCFEMEAHGREDVGIDVSRTIGWFTSLFPVALQIDRSASPGESAREVRGQLRGLPLNGAACGALKYLYRDGAVRQRATAARQPSILFNYLGHFQLGLGHGRWFEIGEPTYGPLYGARNGRMHVLQCVAAVVSGRLHVYWLYSAKVHRAATVEAWIALFESQLARFLAQPSERDRTLRPQDFPDATLTEADLEVLFGESGR